MKNKKYIKKHMKNKKYIKKTHEKQKIYKKTNKKQTKKQTNVFFVATNFIIMKYKIIKFIQKSIYLIKCLFKYF